MNLRRLTNPWAVAVVLAAFGALLIASVRGWSLTVDEIVHATSGFSYWQRNDYRLDPENGNLPQRLMGLSLLAGGYRFPSAPEESWRHSQEWELADQWFHGMGNDVPGMLLRGRAAMALLAVALAAAVWATARRWYGPAGGMLALLLCVLNPAVLANGALMTSDTAASLFFLLSVLAFDALLQRLTAIRLLLSAFAMGGLFVSKMSAPLIVPMALILALVRIFDPKPWPVGFGRPRAIESRAGRAGALAALLLAHAIAVLVVIWASFGFRYSAQAGTGGGGDHLSFTWEFLFEQPSPSDRIDRLRLTQEQRAEASQVFAQHDANPNLWTFESVDALQSIRDTMLSLDQTLRFDRMASAPPSSLVPRVLDFARRRRLLPEAYVYGAAHVWKFSRQRGAFLNGAFSYGGWRAYYPYTFLVKTPLPLLGLLALALAAAVAGEGRGLGWRTRPLWTLIAVYGIAAVFSHIDVGQRHILVLYGPLFVLGGGAAFWLESGRSASARAAVLGGLALLAAETAYRFPNYIAYFNGIVRPAQGYRHLVDSSLDWGQDLAAVPGYLREHRSPGPLYLAYFGSASPDTYGIGGTYISLAPGLQREHSQLRVIRLPAATTAAALPALRRRLPLDDIVLTIPDGTGSGVFALRPPLRGGTYLVSATMLQPVLYSFDGPFGPWNSRYEETYQRLKKLVGPLLAGDAAARAEFAGATCDEWISSLVRFDNFQFGRLSAYLRRRGPDDELNSSILVFHLSDEEVARALDGPPPEFGPDVPALELSRQGD